MTLDRLTMALADRYRLERASPRPPVVSPPGRNAVLAPGTAGPLTDTPPQRTRAPATHRPRTVRAAPETPCR
jgi:hypothetical protein